MKNKILEELRQTRERLLAESGGTLQGLVARLQAEEKKSERPMCDPKELPLVTTFDHVATSDTTEENTH